MSVTNFRWRVAIVLFWLFAKAMPPGAFKDDLFAALGTLRLKYPKAKP